MVASMNRRLTLIVLACLTVGGTLAWSSGALLVGLGIAFLAGRPASGESGRGEARVLDTARGDLPRLA